MRRKVEAHTQAGDELDQDPSHVQPVQLRRAFGVAQEAGMWDVSKNHAINTAKVSTLLDGPLSHRGPAAGHAGTPLWRTRHLRKRRLT